MAEAAARSPVLEARDLTRHFDVSPPLLERLIEGRRRVLVKAVDGLSFEIRRGETFALVGESGCGKSTVARLALGLYRPTSGQVLFDGIDLASLHGRAAFRPLRRRMQMIFQDPFASLNPRWRVRDLVAEPLRLHAPDLGRAEVRARVGQLLTSVGLSPEDGDRYPHQFSGGQRQRISIARALASGPDFLVCDEPTSSLDVSVQAQILNLMKDLQRQGALTYLFISHNLAVVSHVADRVGVMYLGRLVEEADTETLFRAPAHPYTRLLLDTVPVLEATGRTREPLPGEVPSPIAPPPGCAFHPRCPFVEERCRRERPAMRPHPAAPGRALVACHAVEEQRLP